MCVCVLVVLSILRSVETCSNAVCNFQYTLHNYIFNYNMETLITSSIVIKLKTLPIISVVFAVNFSGKVLIVLESFVIC